MHPFASTRQRSVSAWGEEKLIPAIRRWLGSVSPASPFGIGDDCALLPATRARRLVTVDPVVFGRHFGATTPPRLVGEKLLKRNLSDIAAMGGTPSAAVVALTLDARTRLDWLEAFYRGLAAAARRYAVAVVGGDISQADGIVAASLTLVGDAGARVITRVGAQIGDAIYVTGRLGRSVASGRHLTFEPRLREGRWLAARPEVRAMMDLSDGLAKDLWALTPAGSAPAITASALPRCRGADLRSALAEGEDYELLFAVAARADHDRFERHWARAFPSLAVTRIGSFVPANAVPAAAVKLHEYRGYEHLR